MSEMKRFKDEKGNYYWRRIREVEQRVAEKEDESFDSALVEEAKPRRRRK